MADLLASDLDLWPSDGWLAFDDYQFACDSEEAERFVERLCSASAVQLLVASRTRPRWASSRRVIYGEISEMGQSLLAMDAAEAHGVLRGRSEHETSGLIALANGWPALIGLATLPDELALPLDGVADELCSFFADEVYRAVPPETQRALTELALAPSLNLEVAESLLGDKATDVLQSALHLGFFSSWSGNRWEFHPLLRTFLAAKFASRDEPRGKDVIESLVRVYTDRHDWDSAFAVLERFFDPTEFVKLFETALPRVVSETRIPTLTRWIALAAQHRLDAPVIDLAEAEVSFKQGSLRRAEAFACQAARRFAPNHGLRSNALWLAGVSAHILSRDIAALEHFGAAMAAAKTHSNRQQALWGRFSSTTALDESEAARQLLDDLEELSGTTVDELLRVATGRLMLASLAGQVWKTLDAVAVIAPLTSRTQDPLIRSSFLNVHSALLSLAGRYAEALSSADEELELASTHGLAFTLPHACFQRALAFFGLRSFRACRQTLRACEEVAMKEHNFVLLNIGVLRARLKLIDSPSDSLRIFEQYEHAFSTKAMHGEYLAWWSLALALAGEGVEAQRFASRAASMSPRIEVSALIPWTRAVVALAGGQAAKVTNHAFDVALKSGNADAFVTAYRACPELLAILASEHSKQDRLKIILERAYDHRLAESAGLHLPDFDAGGLTTLTRRESEVLELIVQGLMNKEIARTLFITESTAKVHVRRICRKLGVRTRVEAAVRASELGM
jgi:ATP/maltotriose-dependent transcriptional regulator MalT